MATGTVPAAPSRVLLRLGAGPASLADFRGKPVFLNFWASWCEACEAEAPALRKAQAQLRRAGGTVLGVTVQDATPDSQAFAKEHALKFPSLRDVDGDLGKDYGRTGVPETFIIDRDGRVAAISRGQVDDAFFQQNLPAVLR